MYDKVNLAILIADGFNLLIKDGTNRIHCPFGRSIVEVQCSIAGIIQAFFNFPHDIRLIHNTVNEHNQLTRANKIGLTDINRRQKDYQSKNYEYSGKYFSGCFDYSFSTLLNNLAAFSELFVPG